MFDSEGPEFVQFRDGGAVHVYVGLRQWSGYDHVDPDLVVPGLALMVTSQQTALCGRRGEPGATDGISEFPDELLCRACFKKVPVDEQDRLFEHD